MKTYDSDSFPNDAVTLVHDLLRTLQSSNSHIIPSTLSSCLLTRKKLESPLLNVAEQNTMILTDILNLLAISYPNEARLLRGRFWQGRTVKEMILAEEPTALSERSLFNLQQQALEHFTMLLVEQEQRCRQQQSSRILQRLNVSNTHPLFGVEQVSEQVLGYLNDVRHHPIISLKGIGGIGKTTLADHLVRQHVQQQSALQDVIWISAKQEYLTTEGINAVKTQIRLENLFDELGNKLRDQDVLRLPLAQKVEKLSTLLRSAPYLVVFDNLENVEDFRQLIPWLEHLVLPTQFLLTARETIPSLTNVTQLEVNQLGKDDACALIEHIAQQKEVANCDTEAVYDLVGGNPLAIILLVSQMSELPVQRVLERVRLGEMTDLYNFIFSNAWSLLSSSEKGLLFTIQRVGDQADWEWLAMVSEQPVSNMEHDLQRLRSLSLVQIQHTIEGLPLYSIHRLTSTFLRGKLSRL